MVTEAGTPISASAVQPDPLARHYTVTCPRPKRPYMQPRALTTAAPRVPLRPAPGARAADRAFAERFGASQADIRGGDEDGRGE